MWFKSVATACDRYIDRALFSLAFRWYVSFHRTLIDRSVGVINIAHEVVAPVHESPLATTEQPVPIGPCVDVTRVYIRARTRSHFRHASLNNGINRPRRVINCRCLPDMTVYSFVWSTFLISMGALSTTLDSSNLQDLTHLDAIWWEQQNCPPLPFLSFDRSKL